MKNTDKKIIAIRQKLHGALANLGYRDDHVDRPEVTADEFEKAEDLIGEAHHLCMQIDDADLGIKVDSNGEVLQ